MPHEFPSIVLIIPLLFTLFIPIGREKPPLKTQLNIDITSVVLQNKAVEDGRK